jgi:hypothetical protein
MKVGLAAIEFSDGSTIEVPRSGLKEARMNNVLRNYT